MARFTINALAGYIAGAAISLAVLGGAALAAQDGGAYPVAGLKPDQRPAGAPVISFMQKDAAWYSRALSGVSKPYPPSLWFLDNQGAWFNPFQHPGMLPPYDIRSRHKR